MKKILVILILTIVFNNISSAQSGWGYVNYTSYRTHNGNGSTNQYSQFANNAAGFDIMFNTANSNTTIFRTGEVTLQAMASGSSSVPRWGSDFFGYKFEFFFIPQETGTYRFGINSDDASDLFINGNVVSTYYGGHGASAYQYGTINLIAGQRYSVVARMQEYGGGEAFFFHWSRPSSPNTYSYWANEITNQSSISLNLTFDFGQSINRTNFTTKLLVQSNNQYLPTTNTSRTLSNLGAVNMTSDLDTLKVAGNGFRATTTGGQVEWCVVYDYEPSNQRYQILIDKREFPAGVSPSSVTNLKLFDLWDGPVTYQWEDTFWAAYWINTPTQFNFAGSSFTPNIRRASFFWGLSAEFTFTQSQNFKPHGIELNTTNVTSLYNSIVTVSDVFLAFKEVSNRGLLGNESGLEFSSGIQYMNSDVDENGIFDERDTYKLIQHLVGEEIIGNGSSNLSDYMKILPKSEYDAITKLNWNTKPNSTTNTYSPINLSTTSLLNTFTYDVFWKGDVNMSHSALQANNARIDAKTSSEINAYIISEVINNKVIVTINYKW